MSRPSFSRLLSVLLAAMLLSAGGSGAARRETLPASELWQLAEGDAIERWWWRFQQRAYPLVDIPGGALTRAFEQIRQAEALSGASALRARANLWVGIGPAPVEGGQIGTTGGTRAMSGRVNAIAVDPDNPRHWLIGADGGGIWESRDQGATWAPRTDGQISLSMGALAFGPGDPRTVYAMTGAELFSGLSYAGGGLLKSTDGGTTWQAVPGAALANLTCASLKVHPASASVLLAAMSYGFAGRGSESVTGSPRGLSKSTDGGATWSLKLSGDATALTVDPTNFSNQYAGLGLIFGSPANGVYRSTDEGATWAKISGPWTSMAGGIGRVSIAIAPSNPNVAYVSIQDALDGTANDGALLGLWQTTNAWAPAPAWTAIPVAQTDDGSGTRGFCGWDPAYRKADKSCSSTNLITVDPSNPSVLYAGGVALWKFDGVNWTEVSKTASAPAQGIHVDQRGAAWAGNRLILGNDGGVWSTTDGGNSWNGHNTGLSVHEIYGGSLHPSNANAILAGSQDNGTAKWNGSAWTFFFGGDGSDSAISLSKPDTNWAVSAQNLDLRRTTNGGVTNPSADAGIDKTGAPFIARFAGCPSNEDTFIAGTDNLWRSANFFSSGSPSWSSNGPKMGSGISALAFAPSDGTCGTYAFGTANGQLRLTANGGSSWTDLDASNLVPNRFVTGFAFAPGNANTLYVTLSGFDEGTPGKPGHVFRTGNALAAAPAWSNVTPPVNIPFNSIAIDPADGSRIYVGTDIGVWASADGGASWTHMGPESGMPNVPVFDLKVDSSARVTAFTYGRGAFQFAPSTGCSADASTFCAGSEGRFKVRVAWNTPDGKTGAGQAVALTSETAYFWFFSSNNVEIVVKVVDGRPLNGKFWVFAAGLTNVNVVISVTDTQTGVLKTYSNPQGAPFLPIQDTSAFSNAPGESIRAPAGDSASDAAAAIALNRNRLLSSPRASTVSEKARQAACAPDATTLCMNGGRFRVRATWTTQDGRTGPGQAISLTGDTGYFWFFSSSNVEMVVKAVTGCPLNASYWVFAGGLTNVNVVMTVTDTVTGAVKTYTNPLGTAFAPIQDTSAFPCP